MRLAALLVVAGCGVETASTQQAIVGGAPAPADVAVVALLRRSARCMPDAAPLECTGTLVAPRVVVTAAHCVGDSPTNALEVFIGDSVAGPGRRIAVIGGRLDPTWDPETHANDIAALILADDAQVTPLAMATATAIDARLVGYGITSGTGTDVGERRAGTARVMALWADEVRLEPGPAMSCKGDSGGPVLQNGALVAVTSYGDPACTQYGVAMRIDAHMPFIESVIAEAAASPMRLAFDPDASLCATSCASDADCPAETVCFEDRCVYAGLPAGEFGAICTSDGPCQCVAMPDSTCREFLPCVTEGESTCRTSESGCGCGTSSGGSFAIALAVLGLLSRRSAKRRPAMGTLST
jgi:uncharacterized protein (TIGR03382 family)